MKELRRGFAINQRRFIGATIFVLFVFGLAVAQRRERRIESWRPLHYEVSLSFDDELTEISSARTEITLQILSAGTNRIDLDFGEMPVDAVSVSGQPTQFTRTPNGLDVALPSAARNGDQIKVAVSYHGHPKDGLIFATDSDGKPSVTGDNWPNRVHQWIPCLDHPSAKATVSFTISAPQRYEVIANGKFITVNGNAATSQWKFEEARAIPPYCMVITVNQGAIINSPDKLVTNLLFNVPQRDREYASQGFAPAGPALSFFSETVGPYPYEKLALIIAATRFGGMENSSAIVFPNTLFELHEKEKMSARFGIPERIESVVAHEIAHQWFGDSVTESTWADLWLSEGFATYFAGLFIEKHDGEAAFRQYMNEAALRYFAFEKQQNIPIHDTQTVDLMKLLNENNYEKGAWVLHMLRRRLGDEAFFRGLRNYYREHREGNAATEDLKKDLEKSSSQNLNAFFARWIFGSGHPRYQVESSTLRNTLTVSVSQLQAEAAFPDPVPIEITMGEVRIRRVIYPKSKTSMLRIPLKGKLTSIRIDPDETILREIVQK